MSFKQYFKRALSLPPHVVAVKTFQLFSFWANSYFYQLRDQVLGTYSSQFTTETPRPLFQNAPLASDIRECFPELPALLEKTRRHEFDLLGSGWVKVHHQTQAQGVGGFKYPPQKGSFPKAGQIDWVSERINRSNQNYSTLVWKKISADYQPIDWHLDFKSGYRWPESTWWYRIPYGHKPGVDIKVPWEISRAQHLPWLSFGYITTKDSDPLISQYNTQEFQNQILDFIASNPPHFGVNWRCAMDVAIRAANWVLTYDFFRLYGASFDADFTRILLNSLQDHGKFIFRHLEIGKDGFRGNHYLADICGLAFIAAFLPATSTTEKWLKFSHKALQAEMDYQFFEDGSNFEGSTSYHRLSAEMMLYTTLLFGVLNKSRDHIPSKFEFADRYLAKLQAMAKFSETITRPDQNITQVGDCDSGRFFKLQPLFDSTRLNEKHLSHLCLVDSLGGLFGKLRDSKTLEGRWFTKAQLFETQKDLPIPSSFIDEKAMKKDLPTDIVLELEDLLRNPYSKKLKTVFSQQVFKIPLSTPFNNKETYLYIHLGLLIWKSPTHYLGFRCGPVGQKGRGGHDHNDQLSLEVFADERLIVADPGTAIYTPLPDIRNTYRSIQAHFSPWVQNEKGQIVEPAPLDQGLFSLNGAQKSHLLYASDIMMVGYNPNLRVLRIILDRKTEIEVTDICLDPHRKLIPYERKNISYSEGYGIF